ncbi:hypothetical protein OTU49_000299 [Cherax quadricarinatus]|uniref:C2H2-type domain-containing protein n=1 Tax=Cherax quadricarinatus TaxID=27406 RepID=A0AAW0XM55_CHEQU
MYSLQNYGAGQGAALHASYIRPPADYVPTTAVQSHVPALTLDKNESWPKYRWKCPHPTCDYVTHCESKLKMHYRRHTGEKPFICPYCSFKSAQKGNLNVHIKKYHIPELSQTFPKPDTVESRYPEIVGADGVSA